MTIEKNVIDVSGDDGNGMSAGQRKTASVTVLECPAIGLSVQASPETVHRGEDVIFSYQITNPGPVALQGIALRDSYGDVTLPKDTLAVGEVMVATRTHTFT